MNKSDSGSKSSHSLPGPVVIGGIGGSGTRVVAEILHELNFYIGNDLNGPLDNLTYTLLFKRRNWFYRHRDNRKKLFTGLAIMEKAMTRTSSLSFSEYLYVANACYTMARHGHNKERDGSGGWPFDRLRKMFEPQQAKINSFQGWGWKEPNSHLLLRAMNDFFPDFKYIHTIRNGLDMAYSPNQQQLFNWGPMFGVELPAREDEIPQASFKYWVAANKSILNTGRELGEKRFFVLNFDKLCHFPESEITRLLSFLDLSPEKEIVSKLLVLPQIPSSSGRYHDKEQSWVTNDDLMFLKSCGFNVD